jgi:superoxide dismutase, Fe-Mn family
MPYTLPALAYEHSALEPYIDERTVRIHHDQYHRAYIERLNPVLEGSAWDSKPIAEVLRNLEQIPEDKRRTVRNMGGGHYNHSLYFEALSPSGGGEPKGALARAMATAFGSFAQFQQAFFQAGGKELFGAGWAWLVHGSRGLEVMLTANQDNPVSIGKTPLLGIDVWEHAYYPQYLSRKDYFDAFWHIVSWEKVAERFAAV